jgi:hypothetical protein
MDVLVCPICSKEILPDDPVIFQDGKTYHLLCLAGGPKPPAPPRRAPSLWSASPVVLRSGAVALPC